MRTGIAFVLAGVLCQWTGAYLDGGVAPWLVALACYGAALAQRAPAWSFLLAIPAFLGIFGWFAPVAHNNWMVAWPGTVLGTSVFLLWEAVPLVLPLVVAAWLGTRLGGAARRGIFVAGFMVGLEAFLPRPYGWLSGSLLVEGVPWAVWALGLHGAGGVVALLAFILGGLTFERTTRASTLSAAAVVTSLGLLGMVSYQLWSARLTMAAGVAHRVAVVQPGLAPFAGGFLPMAERCMLTAVVANHSPVHTLIYPEGGIRVHPENDPPSKAAIRMSAYKAMIESSTRQLVLPIRENERNFVLSALPGKAGWTPGDYSQSFATPMLDQPPAWLRSAVPTLQPLSGLGDGGDAGLLPLNCDTPSKGLRASVLLGSEPRRPGGQRFMRHLDPSVVALINPTQAGWLGPREADCATRILRGVALQMGLVLYTVGQSAGTFHAYPWDQMAPQVQTTTLRHGFSVWETSLPAERPLTPYAAGLWLLVILLPLLSLTALLWHQPKS